MVSRWRRVQDFERVLNAPYKNKNNLLYWYFTRYVLFYEDFNSDGFLYNFLTEILERYKKSGIDFNFYHQINDFNKIFDYVLQYVINVYENEKETLVNSQNEIKHEIISLQDRQDNTNSEIDNICMILQNYIDKQKQKRRNVWYKKIFSVNKTKHHKYLCVFGIKFNIKRRK